MTAYRAPGEVLDDLPEPIVVEKAFTCDEVAPLIGRPRTDVAYENDDLPTPRFVAALAYIGLMSGGLLVVGQYVAALLFVPVLISCLAFLKRFHRQT